MEEIVKELKLKISSEIAYDKFLHEINEWWPKEYTWSRDKLKEIKIDGQENGLCTEIGPHGFRCDWGRITELVENRKIKLKWQISPKREPIPDPEKSSDIKIEFFPEGEETNFRFTHFNFENHGESGKDYKEMMGSDQGWDYILNRYKEYCER